MRGRPENNGSLWYSITVEDLIEPGHPLRAMKRTRRKLRNGSFVTVTIERP